MKKTIHSEKSYKRLDLDWKMKLDPLITDMGDPIDKFGLNRLEQAQEPENLYEIMTYV